MNREKMTVLFARLVLVAIAMSGMLALGRQNAQAQAIVVTTPFAFSAGGQFYPAGTYELTLLSEWSLSIRDVNGLSQKFFAVRPEDNGRLESKGILKFRDSDGHQTLEAVYVPGRTAELLLHDEIKERAKSERSLTRLHGSPGKLQQETKNATGR